MSTPILVLDHGYVEFIEAWGRGRDKRAKRSYHVQTSEVSEELVHEPDYEIGIVEAARQSTQGSFRGWEMDEKLLKHLYTSKPQHAGPFEFSGMVLEIQAPIFVFREWHRHRTQSYNEMSARYAPLPNLYYRPTVENLMERAKIAMESKNKQEKGTGETLTPEKAQAWIKGLDLVYTQTEYLYQHGLDWGVPKEIARACMPVGHYTRMRASANLRNWLAFLTLRLDPAAQWEIRQYAGAVSSIILDVFPRTAQLFMETA